MPNSPSPAEHRANYARLVALAKADHDRRLASKIEDLTKVQQELAPIKATLAVRPWPRRWWGYARLCIKPGLSRLIMFVALLALIPVTMTRSLAAAAANLIPFVVLAAAATYLRYDELRLQIKHRQPLLRDLEADEETIVASYLSGRLAPTGVYTGGPGGHSPAGHFAFEYSVEAAKQDVRALPTQASRLARNRGFSPEIKLAIWAAQQFAADQDRLAERVARVTQQLIAIGRWAWQDGTLDYRYEGNAEQLAVALAVVEIHERLDRLWRFGEPDAEIDVTTTLASAEWSGLEARVAGLHAAGYALLPD